METAPTFG